jgi:hypothetical protein
MKSLRRHLSLIALLLAWSSWLSNVADGPKVLCIEGESQINVESAASACCSDEASEVLEMGHLQGGDDCDGCEDTVLNLVARSREGSNDDVDGCDLNASLSWELSPSVAALPSSDGSVLRSDLIYSTLPVVALHVLPGSAPLIC